MTKHLISIFDYNYFFFVLRTKITDLWVYVQLGDAFKGFHPAMIRIRPSSLARNPNRKKKQICQILEGLPATQSVCWM